jgi:adenylate cyclase
MQRVGRLFDWLVDGAPGANTAPEVIARMAADLSTSTIGVHRIGVFVKTLHPTVVGRAFWWEPDKPVRVLEMSMEMQISDMVKRSPVVSITTAKKEFRHRLDNSLCAEDFAVLHELRAEGHTDFVGFPVIFLRGETHAVTFTTKKPGGFDADDLAALRQVMRPLSRVTEILALHRTAANLLSVYVGHNSGERILAGRIFKGDIETIRAVIWFSDLRGFTELSARSEPRQIIDTLNELFDCQVPAIEEAGGEVLKFIGDGLLAIFPIAEGSDADSAATRALGAAKEAFAALDARNGRSAHAIDFGLALHLGEFAYGNIGGSSRLDFTAIGPAINVAARLEGLTGKLGRRIVTSATFRDHAKIPMEKLGEFELKGVPGLQNVYAPSRKET